MYYPLIKKVLFRLDAERSHELAMKVLQKIAVTPFAFLLRQSVPTNKVISCMGLSFKNPLGLAAGFDKDGEYINILSEMGFGFIEIGTVTPRAQLGHDRPRLFRVVKAQALINRMGFNNKGVDNLIYNVKKANFDGILGINIGKNHDTPLEKSKDDYLICMNKIYPYASYITINISSPNTKGLRSLQYGALLDDLLVEIKNRQNKLYKQQGRYVPIAIKIAPDLATNELIQVADILVRNRLDAFIVSNTTLDRSLIQGLDYCEQRGGLSGRPLQSRSTEVIRLLSKELKGRLPIIGVGGIDSLISAREKIAAGASLIQIYSGLIFHGPKLIKTILTDI